MAIWHRSGGSWISVHTPHINVDNVWRQATGVWVRTGGVWAPAWEYTDNNQQFTSTPVGDGFRYTAPGGWTHKNLTVSNIVFNAYSPSFDGSSAWAQLSLTGETNEDFIRFVTYYPRVDTPSFVYNLIKANLVDFSVSAGISTWSWRWADTAFAPPLSGVQSRVIING